MSYKRTLVFFIIFAALLIFFYFYEFRGGEARKQAEQTAKLLLHFNGKDVTTIALRRPEQRIVAQCANGKWTITEPVNAPAEGKTLDQMLETLAGLKYERDIGEQADLGPFGLSEPEAEVELKGSKGDIGGLLLGTLTPDGANFYVKRTGDGQVFTVSKSAKSKIDRSLFDMRDKTVFDFSVPDVRALTVSPKGQTFTFESRPEGEWLMTSPERHSADAGKITRVLDSIKYARVKKFVEEAASDFEKYGLATPAARVEVVLDGETKVLSLGKQTGPDSKSVYARRDDQPQVLELDAGILNSLPAGVEDWRDRRLVRFDRAKVEKLETDSPEGRIVAERSPEDAQKWTLTEPEQAVADKDRIASLLSELQDAKVSRFPGPEEAKAAEPAFERPLIRLSLWQEDGKPQATLLLSRTDERPDIYARTGEGGEILVVGERLLSALTVSPNEIKDKSVLRFNAADIEKIDFAAGGKSFEISRKDVQWDVPDKLGMESYEIDQFLWDLSELKYKTVGPKEKDDKAYGFDSPSLIVTLWSNKAGSPMRLLIGKKTPGEDSYYALTGSDKQVMEVEAALISEWMGKF